MQISKYVDLFQNFPSFGILSRRRCELRSFILARSRGLAVLELVVTPGSWGGYEAFRRDPTRSPGLW